MIKDWVEEAKPAKKKNMLSEVEEPEGSVIEVIRAMAEGI